MLIACARAYNHSNIKKGFVLNGQLHPKHHQVPSFSNLIHTYRGDDRNSCLERKNELFDQLYEDAYLKGMISEDKFDELLVPKDVDSNGHIVERDMPISQENRQRAKSLSSQYQINDRRKAVFDKQMVIYNKNEKLFNAETEVYDNSKECENQIVKLFQKEIKNDEDVSFEQVAILLTHEMMQKFGNVVLKKYITSFIKVRSEATLSGYKITYKDIPKLKPLVINKMWELHSEVANPRLVKQPALPTLVSTDQV